MGLNMADLERQLGVVKDILLPLDKPTRYDLYLTNKRIVIVCMGRSSRMDSGVSPNRSFLFGIAPEALQTDQRKDNQTIEEKLNSLSLDEKLKLSRKSCCYTYPEIEEAKLVSGKNPKFVILSKECVSKFSPNEEQFKQLTDLLPNIEMLKGKISIFGNLELKGMQVEQAFSCKYCGSKNDADAIFCESCGMKIREETINPAELTCHSCGTKNRLQASFCKKCGTPMRA